MKVVKAVAAVFAIFLLGSAPVTAGEPVVAKIPVSCKASGINEEFTYTITAEESEAPMPKNAVLTLKDGEQGTFDISYTEPDTWHYEIHQNKPDKADDKVEYDKGKYTAIVSVGIKEDGSLYTETSIMKPGSTDKSISCTFVDSIAHDKAETPTKKPSKDTDGKKGKTTKEKTSSTSSNTGGSGSSSSRSSGESSSGRNITSVQTGDTTNPMLYMVMALAAFTVILMLIGMARERKEE